MDLLREDRAHHNQRTWEIKQSPSLQQVSHGEGVEGREAGSCASSRTRRSRQERNRNPYLIEWICSLYIEEETRRWTRADHYLERALGKKERKNAFFWPAELFSKLAGYKRVERGWGDVSSLLVEVSRCSVVEVGIKDRRGRKGGVGVAEQEGCSCAIQDGWTQRRWTASLWDKMFFSLCVKKLSSVTASYWNVSFTWRKDCSCLSSGNWELFFCFFLCPRLLVKCISVVLCG